MREASNHLGGQCGKSNVWHNIVFIFCVWNILTILKDLIYVFQFFSCINILRCTRENGLVQQQQPIFCRFSTSDYFLHNAFKIYFQIVKNSVFNQNLLENPRLRKIAHAFDWFILPIANPDGYRYSRKVCTGDNGCLKNGANDLIFSEKNLIGDSDRWKNSGGRTETRKGNAKLGIQLRVQELISTGSLLYLCRVVC